MALTRCLSYSPFHDTQRDVQPVDMNVEQGDARRDIAGDKAYGEP